MRAIGRADELVRTCRLGAGRGPVASCASGSRRQAPNSYRLGAPPVATNVPSLSDQVSAGADSSPARLAMRMRARFGGSRTQRSSACFDRVAAGGDAFVRRAHRVDRDHANALESDIELFGRRSAPARWYCPDQVRRGPCRPSRCRRDRRAARHRAGGWPRASPGIRAGPVRARTSALGAMAEGDDNTGEACAEFAPVQIARAHGAISFAARIDQRGRSGYGCRSGRDCRRAPVRI